MQRYRLTLAADADLVHIWNYTAKTWGQNQAGRYLKQLERCFVNLAKSPKKSRSRDEILPDLFSYQEGKHVIFFKKLPLDIIILRVLHERMDIPRHLGRSQTSIL